MEAGSTYFLHRQRTMSSSPILKPTGLHLECPTANVFLPMQKKPDIGSVHVVSGSASSVAPFEMIWCCDGGDGGDDGDDGDGGDGGDGGGGGGESKAERAGATGCGPKKPPTSTI